MTAKCLLLIDRDGVINHDSDDYVKSPDEWRPIAGSIAALAALKRAGCTIAIVTNQSGIARGLFSDTTLAAIHDKLFSAVKTAGGVIDALAYCPHHPDDRCACRKPKIGMLQQIYAQLEQSVFMHRYLIGDSYSDIAFGIAADAVPLLVHTGKGQRTRAAHPAIDCQQFSDLQQASQYIIASMNG